MTGEQTPEITARLEALERQVQALRESLAVTQALLGIAMGIARIGGQLSEARMETLFSGAEAVAAGVSSPAASEALGRMRDIAEGMADDSALRGPI